MKNFIGLLILVAVIGIGAYLALNKKGPDTDSSQQTSSTSSKSLHINGLIGGEKSNLLKNPEVVEILRDKYNIQFNATKTGSIDMVTTASIDGQDFLWPSNQIAVDIYKNRGGQIKGSETLFNSPIVLYSWDQVTEALIKSGYVEKRNESYYVVNFNGLVQKARDQASWKDIGLSQLYGKIKIYSTDPTRSNSGNMFAGLLANMLSGGEVLTEGQTDKVFPQLKDYYQKIGHMEGSSSDLFESFLKTGMGAKPIIVGYENQLVEFALAHPDYQELLRSRIRTLYPQPTVWSSHPIIALTDKGKKFIEAIKDPEIQKIAWEQHGFRSGLLGVQNDPSLLKVVGIPSSIDSVMPLPDAKVMTSLIEALK